MAGLAELHTDENGHNSRWSWSAAHIGARLRGAALLDPEVAQHTCVIRHPAALTPEEIRSIFDAAELHKLEHSEDKETTCGLSHVPGKLFLHHRGVTPALEPIVSKIERLVRQTDGENWGLLSDSEVSADGPIATRCVEFHSYSASDGRERCDNHYDAGSLFTADVMLSHAGDFDGGEMQSTSVDERGTPQVTQHTFLHGDLLVFLSHKAHSVAQLKRGRRCVLVIEFWQGGRCSANHRCCDGGVARDAICGHAEGNATYYARYDRPA